MLNLAAGQEPCAAKHGFANRNQRASIAGQDAITFKSQIRLIVHMRPRLKRPPHRLSTGRHNRGALGPQMRPCNNCLRDRGHEAHFTRLPFRIPNTRANSASMHSTVDLYRRTPQQLVVDMDSSFLCSRRSGRRIYVPQK